MALQPVQLNRQEARLLVEDIAHSHGYIPPDMLAAMVPEVRYRVEQALKKKDDMIASSIFTLARNLYTSNARFVFEMLQNADDNNYTRVQAANEEPYIWFRVYHDVLVVECNEDGFTEENLRAICDIGKSSKQGVQGYIGEKGIGFKSVFMAAWKVHIESGPFSFYFQHHQGDSGMGMVMPIWADPPDSGRNLFGDSFGGPGPTKPLTRFMLYLSDHHETATAPKPRASIIQQLWDLPGTVLLFLKNLKSIRTTVFDHDRRPVRSRETRITRDGNGPGLRVQDIEQVGPLRQQRQQRYYVFTHQARNLAKNDNRNYTKAEEDSKAYSTANVVLAFPVDDSDSPVIQAQDLFAFMPVRKAGFDFLIHSDFVTQANRQDIVVTSERNVGLRKAISDAFVEAVLQFCNHPKLQYTWVRYVPQKARLPLEPFWRDFVVQLRDALQVKPVLRSRSDCQDKLFKIKELGRLTDMQVDKDGKPLVPDLLKPELYLSAVYSARDVAILSEYGLGYVQVGSMMPRLNAMTLDKTWTSKLYDNRDEDWHSRLARLILQAWNEKPDRWQQVLRAMRLLPLRSRQVHSTKTSGQVYFPDIYGVIIPDDLGLSMVLPEAAANKDWRTLYTALGVNTAEPTKIRQMVMTKHRLPNYGGIDTGAARNHLRYLYQMYHHDGIAEEDKTAIVFFDHKGRPRHPLREYLYFRGDGEHNLTKLLLPPFPPGVANPDIPFVHPSYLQDQPPQPDGHDKSWTDFLFNIFWLKDNVQFFTTRDEAMAPCQQKQLTPEILFIAKHYSGKLVAHSRNKFQHPEVRKIWDNDPLDTQLYRKLDFECLDGSRRALEETFVPLPALLARCGIVLANVAAVPFLKLEDELKDSDEADWTGFAKYFGIGVADDLKLSLAMLEAIVKGRSKTTTYITAVVMSLYLRIHVQCLGSDNREHTQAMVRDLFSEWRAVLCSPLSLINLNSEDVSAKAIWAEPSRCLWDAPPGMRTAHPLKADWLPAFEDRAQGLPAQDRENLEQFFRRTLVVKGISFVDILDELRHLVELGEKGLGDQTHPHDLYKKMNELWEGLDEKNRTLVRQSFETQAIVYASLDQKMRWFKVSECVWSVEGASIGKACLEPLYPDLAEFFVDRLGVSKLTFALVCQHIAEIGDEIHDISYIKDLLWSLKALLPPAGDETRAPFTEDLKSSRIFPVNVPGGPTQPMSARDEFAIVDRQQYANAFASKVKILDFTMEEVHRLRLLIEWAGLTGRYFSNLVVERTHFEKQRRTEDRYLTRTFASKAHAFTSIAAHFDTPLAQRDPKTLNSILQGITVFRTTGINSSFVLVQDGKETAVPLANSELHLQIDNGKLSEILVPADDEARDFCIASKLPRAFAAYLLICKQSEADSQAVNVVGTIIHAKLRSVRRILADNGIIELNLPRFTSREVIDLTEDYEDRIDIDGEDDDGAAAYGRRGMLESPTKRRRQEMTNQQYQSLLKQVVAVARAAKFPLHDSNPGSVVDGAQRPRGGTFTFSAGDPAVWRDMVGAAGELFVFELLSGLNPKLPGFGLNSWQSTTRGYVSLHQDYAALQPWRDGESDDIFYKDSLNAFTSHLVKTGYLDSQWLSESPEYHIEVKTTMSSNIETPFYMSKYQYARMQSSSRANTQFSTQKKKVYVLFRVFGLESGDIGVKVYVDPEAARKNGLLEFETESWAVTAKAPHRISFVELN